MSFNLEAAKKAILEAEASGKPLKLSDLIGQKVIDVEGYISDPLGYEPVFIVSALVFEDGSTELLEGEHDVAYVNTLPGFDDETMETLYALTEHL